MNLIGITFQKKNQETRYPPARHRQEFLVEICRHSDLAPLHFPCYSHHYSALLPLSYLHLVASAVKFITGIPALCRPAVRIACCCIIYIPARVGRFANIFFRYLTYDSLHKGIFFFSRFKIRISLLLYISLIIIINGTDDKFILRLKAILHLVRVKQAPRPLHSSLFVLKRTFLFQVFLPFTSPSFPTGALESYSSNIRNLSHLL